MMANKNKNEDRFLNSGTYDQNSKPRDWNLVVDALDAMGPYVPFSGREL